jgi:hypothetical protein
VLARIDEHNTIRTPFAYDGSLLTLARNPAILEICKRLIGGYQILSQQNGVINPPARTYNQGAWHRDLPYQHVVFSRPMAINALFCLGRVHGRKRRDHGAARDPQAGGVSVRSLR